MLDIYVHVDLVALACFIFFHSFSGMQVYYGESISGIDNFPFESELNYSLF